MGEESLQEAQSLLPSFYKSYLEIFSLENLLREEEKKKASGS